MGLYPGVLKPGGLKWDFTVCSSGREFVFFKIKLLLPLGFHEAFVNRKECLSFIRCILVFHFNLNVTTGSPSLKFVLRDLYIYKDFVWELLDRVI